MKNIDNIKPNLFIIGAAKCATTSLHKYLSQHPDIYMSDFKEPGFFLGKTSKRVLSAKYRQIDEYLKLFEKGIHYKYRGESTTGYSMYPFFKDVPMRIKKFSPFARLIYVIRDPIERTISHYWWRVVNENERRSPYEAIIRDKFYITVSYYSLQIRQYLEFFSKDQIMIVLTEDLKSKPKYVLKQIFQWLEINYDFIPTIITKKFNVSPQQTVVPKVQFLDQLRYSPIYNALEKIIPKSLKSFIRRLNEKNISKNSLDVSEVIQKLRPVQQKQVEELISLFGLDKTKIMSQWKTLYAKE